MSTTDDVTPDTPPTDAVTPAPAELTETPAAEETPVVLERTSKLAALPKSAKVGLAAGLAVLLVAGGTGATIAAVDASNKAAHAAAIADYDTAVAGFKAAAAADDKADKALVTDLVAAAALNGKVAALVTASEGVVDEPARLGVDTERKMFEKTITGIAADVELDLATGKASADAKPVAPVKLPTISKTDEKDTILAVVTKVEKLTAAETASATKTTKRADTVSAGTEDVLDTFGAVVKSVPASGQVRLDGTPSAGAAERDALVAAIKVVSAKGFAINDVPDLAALETYAATAAAVKASHDAAVEAARVAAEAAAAEAARIAAEAARGSSGGGGWSGGGSDGGSSSGGGGGSSSGGGGGGSSSGGGGGGGGGGSSSGGGGGSSSGGGGGSSSGGGGGGGTSNERPSVLTSSSMSCDNAGGSNSSSGLTLYIPASNVFDYWVSGGPGYWTVTWTCNDGSSDW